MGALPCELWVVWRRTIKTDNFVYAVEYIIICGRLVECNITCGYLLTPWSRVLPEKLAGSQLVKKFPSLYGTQNFITAFTSARHLSLPWASSIQSVSPYPTSLRSILILSSHLRLGLPSDLFRSGFPTKTLYTPLLYPIRTIRPTHLILLDLLTRIILDEQDRSLSSSLCSFLHSPITSTL